MNKGNGIVFLIVVLTVMALCSLIGGFLWPYTINTWLVFFGKQPHIVFWQGALLGFCPILGQATIPCAIATWILMMFLM